MTKSTNSKTLLVLPKNSGLGKYRAELEQLPNEKIIVRAEDVASFVDKLSNKNINCIGLTGEDLFYEYSLNDTNLENKNLEIISKINWIDETALYKKPAICLMSKKNSKNISESTVAVNKKYSNIANEFFTKNKPKEIIYFNGATETAAEIGLADFVIDIVYSGRSAKEAGLTIQSKLFESNIVVIGGRT